MSQPPDLHLWLLANFERGSVTDAIPKEQLWKSFLESESRTGSARKISREEFFSQLGEAFTTNAFKDVKTIRKNGKK